MTLTEADFTEEQLKSIDELLANVTHSKIIVVIELLVYFGARLRELEKAKPGYRKDIFDVVFCMSKFSTEYWEKLGVKFDRNGCVTSLGELDEHHRSVD